MPVTIGASAIVRTGGGGGWGNPYERPVESVVEDVREEFISREAAQKLYGVVLDEALNVDRAATSRIRQAHKKTQNPAGSEADMV